MNNLAGEFMESEYAESLDAIRETIKCISQNAYIFSCENHKSHIDDQQIALRIFYKGITLVKEHGFSFQDIFNEDKEEVISACRKRIETITSETLDDLEVFIRMANNQLDSL